MEREITDIAGNTKRIQCLGCAIEKGEVERRGGSIAATAYFNAHQDWEIPIPGFVIVASRRHLQSIDEFSEKDVDEAIEKLRNSFQETP